MHSLFCVKKPPKTKNKCFIFYVSLTLYKLFGNCQAENGGAFSDSCYFCTVSGGRRPRGRGEQRVSCAHQAVERWLPVAVCCLQSSCVFLTWGSQWLQAKEPVGLMAHGVDGTRGRPCGPRLLVGPPVAVRVAPGCVCGLWLTMAPVVVRGA